MVILQRGESMGCVLCILKRCSSRGKQSGEYEHQSGELSWFMVPLIFSGAAGSICSLINAALAGAYFDREAMAVIGSLGGLLSMRGFLFSGAAAGFGIVLCRSIGSKRNQDFEETFWCGCSAAALMTVWGILLVLAIRQLLGASGVPEKLQGEAEKYMFWMLLDSGLLTWKGMLAAVIQGLGYTGTAGVLIVSGIVLQTGFTMLLSVVFRMGAEGCAAAAWLADLFLVLALVVFLWGKCRDRCKPVLPWRIPGTVWKELWRSGAARAAMMMLIGMGSFAMQIRLNQLPADVIAGCTYGKAISDFLVEILGAYGTAAGILCAKSAGEGNFRRLNQEKRFLISHSLFWSIGFLMVLVIAGRRLIRLLAGTAGSDLTIYAGTYWLLACASGYIGVSLLLIWRNLLLGLGYKFVLLVFGGLEMAAELIFALCIVPEYGFAAVCAARIFKWWLPGLFASAAGVWAVHRAERAE